MLSISHLIIIFLVALIVFGPEKLPELARTLSKAMVEFRRVSGDFENTLKREMRDLERHAMDAGNRNPAAETTGPAPAAETNPSPAAPSDEAEHPETNADETAHASPDDFPYDTNPYYDDEGLPEDAADSSSPEAAEHEVDSPESHSTGSASPEGDAPAGDSSETLNASAPSDGSQPAGSGSEKPINDHPTAA